MNTASASGANNRWRFFRAGGVDQVQIDSGEELLALDALDPKLWVALACPTSGLEFDKRALQLFDMDGDGRIRVSDLVALVRFIRPLLKRPADLTAGLEALPLDGIDTTTPEGQAMRDAAAAALEALGKPAATGVTQVDAAAARAAFHQRPINGDGIVVPESATDAGLREDVTAIVGAMGGEKDLSGRMGVGRATLDAFFAEAEAFLAWQRAGEAEGVHRLGDATASAWAVLRELEPKIEDFFARTRVGAFDPRATPLLNRDEKDYVPVAVGSLSADARELAGFPLAQVRDGAELPTLTGVNPAWSERMARFAAEVAGPVLGLDGAPKSLSYAQWKQVRIAFGPWEAWQGARAGAKVEPLGRARVEALVSGDARARLEALIAQDAAVGPQERALESLERLVAAVLHLHDFANNFVSFRDFYAQKRPAMFQAGTLYLDRRSCELCMQVENVAAHVTTAGLARSYLAYCECVRRSTGQKMTIVAAITDGDSDNLMVGRNGLFRDRAGNEWDATVVRIVDAPISVRQAFWSPYKKLIRFIEEQVARRAAEKEAASEKQLTGKALETFEAAEGSSTSALSPAAPAAAGPGGSGGPAKKPFDVGVVAALGVAVGGLTAALGALLASFFGLGVWMPLGLLALLLVISGPSMLIAWLKLRQRNLGPLLDANGWAVNAMARVNVPLGRSLTEMAKLPAGAARDLRDPFAEAKRPWLPWVIAAGVLALVGLWGWGKLDPWLPERVRAATVFNWAPEATAPVEPPVPTPAPTPAP